MFAVRRQMWLDVLALSRKLQNILDDSPQEGQMGDSNPGFLGGKFKDWHKGFWMENLWPQFITFNILI